MIYPRFESYSTNTKKRGVANESVVGRVIMREHRSKPDVDNYSDGKSGEPGLVWGFAFKDVCQGFDRRIVPYHLLRRLGSVRDGL
jgi:hypothetical protein